MNIGRNSYIYVVQTVGVDGVEVYSPSALIREFPMVRQGAELKTTEDVLAHVSNNILVFISKDGRAKSVIIRKKKIIR